MANRKRFEVISNKDNGVVFPADTVDWQAKEWRVPVFRAAARMARENGDTLMGEILLVREVSAEDAA